ncbi:MAG: hypothetical protein HY280_03555 [Nitrospinae bacterium]|nr:hypothetical protein [Nitrospinota bacterium]
MLTPNSCTGRKHTASVKSTSADLADHGDSQKSQKITKTQKVSIRPKTQKPSALIRGIKGAGVRSCKGYTRIFRAGLRNGDTAQMAIIEMVERDLAAAPKRRRKRVVEEGAEAAKTA